LLHNKILLTGANGQVGQEIKKEAIKSDLDLMALEKNDLDITSLESIKKIIEDFKPSIIINAAAYTAVDLAEEQQKLCQEVNTKGPELLSQVCRDKDILLVHISTDYVFNGSKSGPYVETDEEDPINQYGKSKYEGELAIRSTLKKHIILRTSWVFGIHGNNFLKTIISIGQRLPVLNIVNDQLGNPTSARSIAKCILKICQRYIQHEICPYGTYHFSNKPETTWHDFGISILELAYAEGLLRQIPKVKGIPLSEYNSKSLKPMNSVLSNLKVKNSFDVDIDEWREELIYTLRNLKR